MHSSLMEIYKYIGEEDEEKVIKEEYRKIEGISIDFGIMQKTRKAYVVKCNFLWDDIGSFTALSKFLNEENSNRVSENVYLEECENCSVFGKKNLIVGFGVKDLVIVDAGDVILIADKNREQEIKHLINEIENKKDYVKFL